MVEIIGNDMKDLVYPLKYQYYKNSGAPFFVISKDYQKIFQKDHTYQILIEDRKRRRIPAIGKVVQYEKQSPRLVIQGTKLLLKKIQIYYIQIQLEKRKNQIFPDDTNF